MKLIIHTDGGARGNPGPAAVGVIIEMTNDQFPCLAGRQAMSNGNKRIAEISKRIGETTNNVAEYTAVLEGLRTINNQLSTINKERESIEIHFFLDSNLVVQQLNGNFKVKDAKLRSLLLQVRTLEQEVGGVITYSAIPREQNTHADRLVNKALDQ